MSCSNSIYLYPQVTFFDSSNKKKVTPLFFYGKTFYDPEGNRQRLKPIDFQVLSLLQETGSRTGYEIIKLLNERFKGLWTPSAGTIFPVLARLEDKGFITKEQANTGDRSALAHKITERGQSALKSQITKDTDQELKFIGDYLRQLLGAGSFPHRYWRVAKFLDDLLEEAGMRENEKPPSGGIPPEDVERFTEIFNRITAKIQRFDPSLFCQCGHHPPTSSPRFKLPPIKPPPIPREKPLKEVKGVPIKVEGDDE